MKGTAMDRKLHLLETFPARGDDGNAYVVHGYEHLARLDHTPDVEDQWHATGVAEYKLATGEHVIVDKTGVMQVHRTGVRLQRSMPAPR
jgi:hypothetical protein